MSGLALVLDATNHSLKLLDVATEFSRAGLTRPFIWLTAEPDTSDWSFVVLPVDDSNEPVQATLNETINGLAEAEAIRLHVLVDGLVPLDPEPLFAIIRTLRKDLEIDFGQRIPLATTLVVLPPDEGDIDPAAYRTLDAALINSLGEWNHIFVVSREDSPSPRAGNQLRDEFASVVVHTLLGIDGVWRGGVLADDVYNRLDGMGGRPRIVRGWTRLIDGGFLADHIASSLTRVIKPSRTTPRAVLDTASDAIIRHDQVAGLLTPHPPHQRPRAPLTGLAYILAFIPYFLRHFIGVAWSLLIRRLLSPLIRRAQSIIDRIAMKLGAPRPERTTIIETDQWLDLRTRVNNELRILDEGGDANMAADSPAEFWRPVISTLIGYVDRSELTAPDVVGPVPVSGDRSLTDHLATALTDAVTESRRTIDAHLTMLGEPDSTRDEEPKKKIWHRIRGWIRRKWAWLVVFIGLFMLATGLIAPGLGLVIVGISSFAATWILAAFNAVLQRIIQQFKQHNERGLDDHEIAENLSYHLQHWSRLLHRRSQLDSWILVLRVMFAGVGAGSPIPTDRQCDFLPSQTPDSLVLATGVCSTPHVERLALQVRDGNSGHQLFQAAFQVLIDAHPQALDDPTRHGINTGMKSLRTECVGGLRPEARDIARRVVDQFLQNTTPTSLVEGAVEWVRKVDRFGRRYWTPADGVSPLGPAGRAVATELTRPLIELASEITLQGAVLLDASTPLVGVVLDGNANRLVTTTTSGVRRADASAITEREFDISQTAKPLPMGGLGGTRPGRPVMTVELLSGTLHPRLGTLVEVRRNGSFILDVDAPLGAPIVDIDTRTLIGVVISTGPTLAAGPLMLHTALAGISEVRATVSNDLDTGFRIPRDVALMAPLGAEPDAIAPSELPPHTISVSDFLGVACEQSSNNFVRRVAIDPGLLRVDKRVVTTREMTDIAWQGLDGRLMLSAHSLEFSGEFDLEQLVFTRREEAAAATPTRFEL